MRMILIALFGCLILGGCGGVFSGTDEDRSAGTGPGEFETRLLGLINEHRQDQGLTPLSLDNHLVGLAREHSQRQMRQNIQNHDYFGGRFSRSGYKHCVENVGSTKEADPEMQFEMWMNSPGHDRNLLNQDLRFVGINRSGSFTTFLACD